MKVYVIGARKFPNAQGGIEKHCEELYSRLVKKGDIDITILTTVKNTNRSWKSIKFRNIPTVNKKSLEKIIYGFIASVYSIVMRPDIVHIQGLNASLYIPLLKIFGLKVVYTQHSMDYLYPKWNKLAKKVLLLAEYCSTYANQITVVAPIIKQRFKEKYNKEAIVVYNGVGFNEKNSVENSACLEFDVIQKKYILFVGRITPEKDLLTLITAFDKINDPKLYLLIVGASDHNDNYTNKVLAKTNKNKRIVLTGSINNDLLSPIYENSEVFVLPSKFEAFPIVPLEAIYFKTNVLLSDIPAHKQLELDDKCYFKSGSYFDLQKKITYLLNNPTPIIDREELKKRIVVLYNWDTTASVIHHIYKDLQ